MRPRRGHVAVALSSAGRSVCSGVRDGVRGQPSSLAARAGFVLVFPTFGHHGTARPDNSWLPLSGREWCSLPVLVCERLCEKLRSAFLRLLLSMWCCGWGFRDGGCLSFLLCSVSGTRLLESEGQRPAGRPRSPSPHHPPTHLFLQELRWVPLSGIRVGPLCCCGESDAGS